MSAALNNYAPWQDTVLTFHLVTSNELPLANQPVRIEWETGWPFQPPADYVSDPSGFVSVPTRNRLGRIFVRGKLIRHGFLRGQMRVVVDETALAEMTVAMRKPPAFGNP